MPPNDTTPKQFSESLEAWTAGAREMDRAVKAMDVHGIQEAGYKVSTEMAGMLQDFDRRLARLEGAIERRPPPNHTTIPAL